MKHTLTRESYKNIVTKLATEIQHEITEEGIDITIYADENGRHGALVFVGKSNKPTLHSLFFTAEKRNMEIKNIKDRIEMLKAAKAKRMEPSTLKCGDILSGSWGYEQTNVNFFQVTRVIGKRSVEVREIASTIVSTDDKSHYDRVMPVPGMFLTPKYEHDNTGRPMLKRVHDGDSIKMECFNASLWDGKPEHRTDSGYGH